MGGGADLDGAVEAAQGELHESPVEGVRRGLEAFGHYSINLLSNNPYINVLVNYYKYGIMDYNVLIGKMKNIVSLQTMHTIYYDSTPKLPSHSRLQSIIQQPYAPPKPTQVNKKKILQKSYSAQWWVIASKLIVILSINWYFVIVGFAVAFDTHWLDKRSDLTAMGTIIIMILGADIAINMYQYLELDQTGSGTLNTLKEYFKTMDFICSLTSLIAVISYISYPHIYTLCLQPLFFTSLYKIKKYKESIFLKLSPHSSLSFLFHSLNIVIMILMTTHFLAVFYVLFDQQLRNRHVYSSQDEYWMSNNDTYQFDITSSQWFIKYLYAQFFSLGTWTLIAPGPTPKNPFQTVYTTLVMVFYIIVASKIVDKIIDMVGQENQKKFEKKKESDLLQDVMRAKGVEQSVREKIENYYQVIYEIEKNHLVVKQEISDLPIKMQASIGSQYLKIGKMAWLHELTQGKEKLIKEIFEITFDRIVEADDYIINQDEDGERVVYKCQKSSVLISTLYGSYKQRVNQVRVNDEEIIGGYELVTQQKYLYDAMMLKSEVINGIKRQDFIKVIREEEDDYEKFCEIKDRLLFPEGGSKGGLSVGLDKCMFCGEEHSTRTCRNVYFGERVRQQYWESENERRGVERGHRRNGTLMNFAMRNNRGIKLKKIKSRTWYESEDVDTFKRTKEYFVSYNLY